MISQIYFGMKLYMFRTVRLSNHQEFIHCTLSNGIQTCMTYTIAECTVNKLLVMDRGTVRNM